jgi:hypothetical protein
MVSSEHQIGWLGQLGEGKSSDFRKRFVRDKVTLYWSTEAFVVLRQQKTHHDRWQCAGDWDSCDGVRQPLRGRACAQPRGNNGRNLHAVDLSIIIQLGQQSTSHSLALIFSHALTALILQFMSRPTFIFNLTGSFHFTANRYFNLKCLHRRTENKFKVPTWCS